MGFILGVSEHLVPARAHAVSVGDYSGYVGVIYPCVDILYRQSARVDSLIELAHAQRY